MDIQTSLFDNLSKEDIDYILSVGYKRKFPKKSIIFNQGDDSDSFYYIDEGRIKVFVTDENGRGTTLRLQDSGEYFGDLGLIDNQPRSATVETLVDSKLTMVPQAKFKLCLETNTGLGAKFVPLLAGRVRELTEDLVDSRLCSAYVRFRNKLYDLAIERPDGTYLIEQKFTQQDFGEFIGTARENINRFLKGLKDGGYVEAKTYGTILIVKRLPNKW